MITYFQAIILGLLQGASELFPVSSLGHSIIVPSLFGWNINQDDSFFLIFVIATHFATSLVLLVYFLPEWLKIAKGFFSSIKNTSLIKTDVYSRLAWLLIVTTIPAGILGLIFQKPIQHLFAKPGYIALFLLLNGIMLLVLESFKKQVAKNTSTDTEDDATISKLNFRQGIMIGLAQCLALIPGFSRTGAAIGGGLLSGLNHKNAARYSFLLATPIIFAASALKLPQLIHYQSGLGIIIVGVVAAAISTWFSITYLLKYFENKNLRPFGVYCIIVGLIALLII